MKHTKPLAERRWLNQLEAPTEQFWKSLSILAPMKLTLEQNSVTYEGVAPLEASFVNNQHQLVIPHPSLNVETKQITKVYSIESPAGITRSLELDFINKQSRLKIAPTDKENQQKLNQIASCFGWSMQPETDELAQSRILRQPMMCPGCQQAAKQREKFIHRNPITRILLEQIHQQQSFLFTIAGESAQLTTEIHPKMIQLKDSFINLKGNHQHLKLDTHRIHALRMGAIKLDGEDYCRISIINPHGIEIASLSTPADSVQKTWGKILKHPQIGMA